MSVPFFSTMGMELTWLWPHRQQENDWLFAYSSLLSLMFKVTKFPHHNCHNDGGALEIATPAFDSLDKFSKYYARLEKQLHKVEEVHKLLTGQSVEFVHNRNDTVSGGGHIHVAIPKHILKDPLWLACFLSNLFRDMNNRPYLNWIFNDWGNTQSAENFIRLREEQNKHAYHGLEELKPSPNNWKTLPFLRVLYQDDPKLPPLWGTRDILQCFDINKGYALKVSRDYGRKPNTMEFRCFDTKRDFSEIELHADFVNSYLWYIDKVSKSGKLIRAKIKSREDIAKLALNNRCVDEFKSFTERIGLNYGKYERFVETNYRHRAQAGLLR